MNKYLKIPLAGFAISFLGSLPPGTLNITAFEIAASQNQNQAIIFTVGAVLIEMLVIWMLLKPSGRIKVSDRFLFYLFPVTIIFLLYLAISNFVSLATSVGFQAEERSFLNLKSVFFLGVLLSALNPLQIPFWIGWTKALRVKNIFWDGPMSYVLYIGAIGLGTFLALALFILGGQQIIESYSVYGHIITLLLGATYFGFACYLTYLFFKKYFKLKIR